MSYGKRIIAGVLGLSATAACAQVALPCYEAVVKSCGAIVADTTRTCSFNGVFILCGDRIIQDNNVNDAEHTNGYGFKNTEPGSPVTVQVEVRTCDENTQKCVSLGVQTLTCQGEIPDYSGPECGPSSLD